MSTRDDLIEQTLTPATHDLGGFKVHHVLPHRERTMVGPFLFFDQMGPAHPEKGDGIDMSPKDAGPLRPVRTDTMTCKARPHDGG